MLRSKIDEVAQFWPEESVAKTSRVTTEPAGPTNPELVFVIHGRQLLGDFHNFLRALGLKPLEWSKARKLTGKPNPYTWEIVDKALSEAGAIVALLTPDDEARLRPELWSQHESSLLTTNAIKIRLTNRFKQPHSQNRHSHTAQQRRESARELD